MWWVAAAGVEAGTTNMPNTMEPLPASPLDRPLPDLKPLADAAPLPDVEEAEAEAVALDRELDVWKRQRSRLLPRPLSVQDVGRQVACASEEEGRERRVLSCVSAAEGGRVADEEDEEAEEEADEEELEELEEADEDGNDADTEDEVEVETVYPIGTDERLDQLELDFWKLMGLTVPVPLGALCVAGVGAVAWMMMVATVATRPCLGT